MSTQNQPVKSIRLGSQMVRQRMLRSLRQMPPKAGVIFSPTMTAAMAVGLYLSISGEVSWAFLLQIPKSGGD